MNRAIVVVFALAGCAVTHTPPPPPSDPIETDTVPAIEPYPFDTVWTAVPELSLLTEADGPAHIGRVFTRLDVIGRDTIGLRVTCAVCEPPIEGYVSEDSIIASHLPPEISAWGEFPEFLLSIRAAAARRDLEALRPVMNTEFVFSFIGVQTPEAALAVWQAEGFQMLDAVPDLLDQGVVTEDGRIWTAPPEFLLDPSYQGPRLGFRQRADGRWDWLFLVRGLGQGR